MMYTTDLMRKDSARALHEYDARKGRIDWVAVSRETAHTVGLVLLMAALSFIAFYMLPLMLAPAQCDINNITGLTECGI